MASSCSECNNLFESKNKIKRWARTKRDAHTRKEGTGKCVRCFNKNRRREQRKNARKRVHSDDEDVDAKTPKTSKLSTPGTNMSSVGMYVHFTAEIPVKTKAFKLAKLIFEKEQSLENSDGFGFKSGEYFPNENEMDIRINDEITVSDEEDEEEDENNDDESPSEESSEESSDESSEESEESEESESSSVDD